MVKESRREFIKKGITLASAPAVAPALVQAAVSGPRRNPDDSLQARASAAGAHPSYEVHSSAKSPRVPVRILDTERMPWAPMPVPSDPLMAKYPTSEKFLFENKETKAHIRILYVPPGWPGALNHYHTFHEWAYMLFGDLTNNESTHPDQHFGPLQRYREGTFLDRPAYSLHGGERGRQDFMRSQVGGAILIMEEGDVASQTFGVESGSSNYNPDYKQVKQWAVPRIIDTIGGMPWQPEGSVPGLHIKHLVDDPTRGFRATLWWLEAGWNSSQSPQFARAYYYKQAYQFDFVLSGDLNIQTYQAPGEKAEKIALGRYFYVERAPMSIFGLADGVVTERGCVWLEVTYGKGTAVSNTLIEDPTYV